MKQKIFAILLSLVVAASGNAYVFAENDEKGNIESFYIKSIVDVLSKNYKFGISDGEIYGEIMDYVLTKHPELFEELIKVAAGSMDEHSYYMSADSMDDFVHYIDNQYVGIGVSVERVKDAVAISEVYHGGSAHDNGLMAGDKFIEVNGEDVTAMGINEVAERIRGEEGTFVEVKILRGTETAFYTLERRAVNVSTVFYKVVDNVGYISISRFNTSTPTDVYEALVAFDYLDISNIIIDVRDNPGGELGATIQTLSKFIPKNKSLVKVADALGNEREYKSEANFNKTKYNLVVIVNENSASAAELFAGAIRDNKVGTIIGTKTYGKGSVQNLLGLRSPAGYNLGDIKLTTAEYFLPGGDAVNGEGVKPNIVVKNESVPLDSSDFEPMHFSAKYSLGDSGKEILALKQRLSALGYFVGDINEIFDKELEISTRLFQKNSGICDYGVMDITTQTFLNNEILEATVLVDYQTEKAFNMFGVSILNK